MYLRTAWCGLNEDKRRKKYRHRALRACNVRPRKFYATRHTFLSVALSKGLNTKFLSDIAPRQFK